MRTDSKCKAVLNQVACEFVACILWADVELAEDVADFVVGGEELVFDVDDFGCKLIDLRLLNFSVGED